MSNEITRPGRRRFIKIGAGCLAAIPVVSLVGTGARAEDLPALDETDPTAQGMGYKQDTTQVDKGKYPKHDESQTCSNCQLYQGSARDPQGPCQIFPGKSVTANGWCSAWVAKA